MQTGTIKRLMRDRGYGFISASDGRDIFFHQSSLQGADFASLNEGQNVEFDVEKSPRGPRAINIKLSA
jgi:CspA family cold shock protein